MLVINLLKINCHILYLDGCTVSSGAFKFFENQTVEIKRMYTKTEFRGRNFASKNDSNRIRKLGIRRRFF